MNRRRKRIVLYLLAWGGGVFFAGCGGGEKEKEKDHRPVVEFPEVGGTKYHAAAGLGDLVLFQFNLDKLKYSYSFLEGELQGEQGQGGLSPLEGLDGHVYETYGDSAAVVLLPDQLALVSPGDGRGLFAGVPVLDGDYVGPEIWGVYNFISYAADAGLPNYRRSIRLGSFRLAEETWEMWWGNTAADYMAQPAMDQGTWADEGNGVIRLLQEGRRLANLMLLPEPGGSGARLLVMDFCGVNPHGMAVGFKRVSLAEGSADGVYAAVATNAEGVFMAELQGQIFTLIFPNKPPEPHYLVFNWPWEGVATAEDGTKFLFLPEGIFFGGYADLNPPYPDFLSAGIKQ